MLHKSLFRIASVIALVALSTAANAQARIGTAVRIVNQVTADQSLIVTGDGVSQNQTIEVKPDALGELKLDDATKLALGPGSKLVLDKFVYDPNKSAGDVSVSLAKGAFRFVTGAAQKRDYKIKTPSAAISVRGTVFDIYIAPDGSEWLLLHEGSIEVCAIGGNRLCRQLNNPCNVLPLNGGSVGRPQGWGATPQSRAISFDVAFPFVKNPPTVDPVVYHTQAEVEGNQCPNPNEPLQQGQPGLDRAEAPPSPPALPSVPPPVDVADNAPPSPLSPPELPGPGSNNWSGIYVGATTGHGSGRQTTDINCEAPGVPLLPGSFYPCSRDGKSAVTSSQLIYETQTRGFVGGPQAGINFQSGPLVFGAEADIAYADIDSTSVRKIAGTESILGTANLGQDMRWFGTVRGRAGISFGNVLVFATGGLATADMRYSYELNGAFPGIGAKASKSAFKTGWVAGGGFELGFGLWSWKTEYLVFDLGQEKLASKSSQPIPGFGAATADVTFTPDFETEGQIVRTGLSFHFN